MEEINMKRIFRLAMALFFVVCLIQTARAAIIEYEATSLGGGLWQYDYTIYNDSQTDIYAIDLFFGFQSGPYSFGIEGGPYSNPAPVDESFAGSGWDAYYWPETIISLAGIAEPELISIETLDNPISFGGTLGVFSVAFNWLGDGDPASQQFRLWDADWNDFEYGWTSSPADTPVVPEPGTLVLLGTGLACLTVYFRRGFSSKA
jgi:hypothetical protein